MRTIAARRTSGRFAPAVNVMKFETAKIRKASRRAKKENDDLSHSTARSKPAFVEHSHWIMDRHRHFTTAACNLLMTLITKKPQTCPHFILQVIYWVESEIKDALMKTTLLAQQPTSSRVEWIETLKGITVLLVVMHHATLASQSLLLAGGGSSLPEGLLQFDKIMSNFRMPAFFLCSGLVLQAPFRKAQGGL